MTDWMKTVLESRWYVVLLVFYVIAISVVIVFSVDMFSPLHSFTNKSDSMIPAINQGSQTIVKSYPKYYIGDVISYHSNANGVEEIVTHRIVDIGGNVYTTKGDNNAVADRELVRPRLVIGKVMLIIPYLGYYITFAKSIPGTWICILIPAFAIIFLELFRIFAELEKNSQERKINTV